MSLFIRVLKGVGITLASLVLILCVLFTWLISESGSKRLIAFAQAQVEGLNLVHKQGGLADVLVLSHIKYVSETVDVEATEFVIDLGWDCLWSAHLCIERVHFADIVTVVKPSTVPAEDSAPSTSLIQLPTLFDLQSLSIDTLSVFILDEQSEGVDEPVLTLSDLNTSLSFFERISVTQFSIDALVINAPHNQSGPAERSKQQPVQQPTQNKPDVSLEQQVKQALAHLRTGYEPIEIPQVFIPVEFEVVDARINSVCLNSDQYCIQNIKLNTQHFAQTVELDVQMGGFTGQAIKQDKGLLANTILNDLSDVSLSVTSELQNDLTSDFSFKASSSTYTELELLLKASVNHVDMVMTGFIEGKQNVFLDTRISMQTDKAMLPLDMNMQLNYLPYTILPTWQSSSSVTLKAKGQTDSYKIDARFNDLSFNELETHVFKANVGLNDGVLAFQVERSDGLFKSFPFTISGGLRIHADGQVDTNKFVVNARSVVLQLDGKGHFFNKLPKGKNNTITVFIDANDLEQLHDTVEGSLIANAAVMSPLLSPIAQFDLKAKQIGVNDLLVSEATITGDINAQKKLASRLKVKVNGINYQDMLVPLIELSLNGDETKQALNVNIPKGDVRMLQRFEGALQFDQQGVPTGWQGQWLDSMFAYQDLEISSQDAPAVAFDISQVSLNVQPICWHEKSPALVLNTPSSLSLCLDSTQMKAEQLNTALEIKADVPSLLTKANMQAVIDAARPYLDLAASNIKLSNTLLVEWSKSAGLSLDNNLTATELTLVKGKYLLTFDELSARSNLRPAGLTNQLTIASNALGTISYEGQIDSASKVRTHQGSVGITDIKLSALSDFVPQLERMAGSIDGKIELSGEMTNPSFQGDLVLSKAEFLAQDYPFRLTNWSQDFTFDGKTVETTGEFSLGTFDDGGRGKLSASIDFSEQLLVDGSLKAEGLNFSYDTYSASISPDLSFSVNPKRVDIKGKVNIPEAKIVIKSLPEGAQSPSSDIVVIDEQLEEETIGPEVFADLTILIDTEKKKHVKLEALDLKTSLHGDLRVRVEPDDINLVGKINLLDGEYKAYGQALSISQGEISFTGQPDIPNIDITAIRNPLNTADDVIAGITVSGTSQTPKVSLFSNPDMDQVKQLSYLLTGQDYDKPGEQIDRNTQLVNTLLSFGIGRSENGIGSLGRKLGVDNLNVQAAGQGNDAQVQISGRLSDRIQVSYGLGVFDSVSELKLRYDLIPQVYLEAVSGVNNALDIYYEIERN